MWDEEDLTLLWILKKRVFKWNVIPICKTPDQPHTLVSNYMYYVMYIICLLFITDNLPCLFVSTHHMYNIYVYYIIIYIPSIDRYHVYFIDIFQITYPNIYIIHSFTYHVLYISTYNILNIHKLINI